MVHSRLVLSAGLVTPSQKGHARTDAAEVSQDALGYEIGLYSETKKAASPYLGKMRLKVCSNKNSVANVNRDCYLWIIHELGDTP